MNLHKHYLLQYWKIRVKNRPIIAIISMIYGHSSFKIWCIIFSAMRTIEGWATKYHQITLSLSKFGLSECAEKTRFWVLNPE